MALPIRRWLAVCGGTALGFDGVEDGTLLERRQPSSGPVAASIGRRRYAGATYRHTSTEDARRLCLSPAIAEGRTGLGLLMLSIGARY